MTKLSNAQKQTLNDLVSEGSLGKSRFSFNEATLKSLAARGLVEFHKHRVAISRAGCEGIGHNYDHMCEVANERLAKLIASRYVSDESIVATLEELQGYAERYCFNNIDTLTTAFIAVGGTIVTEEVVTETEAEVVTETEVEVANEVYIVRKLIMGRDGYPLGILDIEVPTDGGEQIGDDNAHIKVGHGMASLVETDDPAATRPATTSDVAAVGGDQDRPQAEETIPAPVGKISARADISMTNCISGRFRGKIKFWNEDEGSNEGYGKISAEYGELYFRRQNLRYVDTPLSVGDTVTFRIWESTSISSIQSRAVDILVDGKTPAPRPVNPVTAAAVEAARQSEVRRKNLLAQHRAHEQARRDARHRTQNTTSVTHTAGEGYDIDDDAGIYTSLVCPF